MNTFILILNLIILLFISYQTVQIVALLVRLTAEVASTSDILAKEKIKDMVKMFDNFGYELNRKDEE